MHHTEDKMLEQLEKVEGNNTNVTQDSNFHTIEDRSPKCQNVGQHALCNRRTYERNKA